MAIIKTIPSQRLINGKIIDTSEVSIVSEKEYSTTGEDCVIVRGVAECILTLNSRTTDHTVIKAMNLLTIRPDVGKIDEEYDEIVMDKGACVEFRFCGNTWYILSSDGLKQS
jgi:ABC-type bacteriocin/lantibiotic exporter with double-glycine peptidase domain